MADININPDEDAMLAVAGLVGRTGARELAIGYLHDGVPAEQAGWWAHAQYRGARITAEDHTGPVEALLALAARLLDGAQCQGCGRRVQVGDDTTPAVDRTFVTGQFWAAQHQAKAGVCVWRREGRSYVRECGPLSPDPPSTRDGGS